MNLFEAKLNTECRVLKINIEDSNTKLRIMELGLIEGVKIKINKKSIFKKTLLIVFCSSCFTLKENFAKQIEVEYA